MPIRSDDEPANRPVLLDRLREAERLSQEASVWSIIASFRMTNPNASSRVVTVDVPLVERLVAEQFPE